MIEKTLKCVSAVSHALVLFGWDLIHGLLMMVSIGQFIFV